MKQQLLETIHDIGNIIYGLRAVRNSLLEPQQFRAPVTTANRAILDRALNSARRQRDAARAAGRHHQSAMFQADIDRITA